MRFGFQSEGLHLGKPAFAATPLTAAASSFCCCCCCCCSVVWVYSLQYSCLEPFGMPRAPWESIAMVFKSDTFMLAVVVTRFVAVSQHGLAAQCLESPDWIVPGMCLARGVQVQAPRRRRRRFTSIVLWDLVGYDTGILQECSTWDPGIPRPVMANFKSKCNTCSGGGRACCEEAADIAMTWGRLRV